MLEYFVHCADSGLLLFFKSRFLFTGDFYKLYNSSNEGMCLHSQGWAVKEYRWVYSSKQNDQKSETFLFAQRNQVCTIYFMSLKLLTGQELEMPWCFCY